MLASVVSTGLIGRLSLLWIIERARLARTPIFLYWSAQRYIQVVSSSGLINRRRLVLICHLMLLENGNHSLPFRGMRHPIWD